MAEIQRVKDHPRRCSRRPGCPPRRAREISRDLSTLLVPPRPRDAPSQPFRQDAGLGRRPSLPPAPSGLLVHVERADPGCPSRPAHRFADRGSDGDGGSRGRGLGRGLHPARNRPRICCHDRCDPHLYGRRLLQPRGRARSCMGRPRNRRRLGPRGPGALGSRSSESDAGRNPRPVDSSGGPQDLIDNPRVPNLLAVHLNGRRGM